MKQEDKQQLLIKELCTRQPWGVKVQYNGKIYTIDYVSSEYEEVKLDIPDNYTIGISEVKPYLRSMSSMTEEEAKEISILYGLKDILSIEIKDECIEVVINDGVCSTEIRTIWYDEIMSSIEIFDFLNAHHFDYRGLIPMGLAIEVTKENNPYKE